MKEQLITRILSLRQCALAGAKYGVERAIAGIARAQHGVITADQLRAAGLGPDGISAWVKRRRLRRIHRGVYLYGPISSPLAPETAAVLACGPANAFVSDASAAYLDQLPPYPAKPRHVHVTVTDGRARRRPELTVHRRALHPAETTKSEGIPTTTPARTILDLAPTLTTAALEHLIAEAYAKRRTSRRQLLAVLDRNPSRPGTKTLRALLDARNTPARTRSNPERRLLALIRKAGLPEPRTNANLHGWEVDFLWAEAKLIVETDALSTHTDPFTFERDRRKDAELTLHGYTVIRVTRRQLEEEPEAVVARIAAALALRRAGT